MLPDIRQLQEQELLNVQLHDLSTRPSYKNLKDRFLMVVHFLNNYQGWTFHEKQRLIDAILESDELELFLPDWLSVDGQGNEKTRGWTHGLTEFFKARPWRHNEIIRSEQAAVSSHQWTSDLVFLRQLPRMCDEEQLLLKAAAKMGQIVREEVRSRVAKFVAKCSDQIEDLDRHHLNAQSRREASIMAENGRRSSRSTFLLDIHSTYTSISACVGLISYFMTTCRC